MFALTDDEEAALARLAERIQHWRVNKEAVADFAARVGVSAPTYIKLEKADPTVKLAILVRTLRLAGRLQELDVLFAESSGVQRLFEKKLPVRQRAARRPRWKPIF